MLADGLTRGTPVLSLIDHDEIHRGDIGHVAGPCDDPHTEDAARRVLIRFSNTRSNMVACDHFIILSSACVDHGLFPVYPQCSIRFQEHVVHDAAYSVTSSDSLFSKDEPFLISEVLPARFRCADGATRTGAVIRAAVQQRRSAAEAWRREEETAAHVAATKAAAEAAATEAAKQAAAEAKAHAARALRRAFCVVRFCVRCPRLARAAAEAAAARAAQEAAAEAAAKVAAARDAVAPIIEELLTRVATWRSKPKRTAEARQRRRRASSQRKRKSARGASDASSSGEAPSGSAPSSDAGEIGPSRDELLRQLIATRHALKDRTEVLALTRKQLKRETKTAKARWSQLARRGSKAQKKLSRKLFSKQARAVAGAARREHKRKRKRKQPESEILHSGERKHQRLLEKGGDGSDGGDHGGGHGSGKGGSGRGGGGKGGSGKGGSGKGSSNNGGSGKGGGGKGGSGKGGGGRFGSGRGS